MRITGITNGAPASDGPPARWLVMTTRDLVERVRRGDLGALEALHDAHAPRLFTIARRITGSPEDAEEIVQDVFVGLPLALERYRESGEFDAWLRVITVRMAIDRLRSERRRGQVPLFEDGARTAGEVEEAVAARITLERAVSRLPATLRIVLVLRGIEGYTHEEIAGLLGIRRGTSEVRYHRALRRLRELLTEGGSNVVDASDES